MAASHGATSAPAFPGVREFGPGLRPRARLVPLDTATDLSSTCWWGPLSRGPQLSPDCLHRALVAAFDDAVVPHHHVVHGNTTVAKLKLHGKQQLSRVSSHAHHQLTTGYSAFYVVVLHAYASFSPYSN
jgi:hypothetical protein